MATAKDPVGAARKALEAAEADAARAAKRAEAATAKAEAFATEAASIDPDADERGFTKATRELADLRAAADLHRSRATSAAGKAEAALAALAAAEASEKRGRLAALDAEIAQRETKAIEAARSALAAFDAEAVEVAKLAAEANGIGRSLAPEPHRARGVRGIAPYAGNPLGALTTLRDGRLL